MTIGKAVQIINGILCIENTTDNAVLRAHGTTGKYAQNSAVTIDDDGVISCKTVVISDIVEGYVPYKGASTGLAASPIYTDGTDVSIGTPSIAGAFLVSKSTSRFRMELGAGNATPTMYIANTAGKAGASLAGLAGYGFAYDSSGSFDILSETRANLDNDTAGLGTLVMRFDSSRNVKVYPATQMTTYSHLAAIKSGADAYIYVGEGDGSGLYGWLRWESSDDTIRLGHQTDGDKLILLENGRMGNIASPTGLFHLDQASLTGAIPVLVLDQGDEDMPVLKVIGASAADASKVISTLGSGQDSGSGAVAAPDFTNWNCCGLFRCDWNGSDVWLAGFQPK